MVLNAAVGLGLMTQMVLPVITYRYPGLHPATLIFP
jgi:hypothetical protein